MKNQQKWWVGIVLLVVLALALAACGGGTNTPTEEAAPTEAAAEEEAPVEEPAAEEPAAEEPAAVDGKTTLGLWTHSAGNPNELGVIEQWVADFNAQSEQFEVVIESFPQESYNDSVAAASVAGSLPCIIDLDGPTVSNFAWSGYVQPLPITEAELDEMGILDNDIGRYNGEIYSVGQFDVALLVYARKSILDQYGIRIPTIGEPWTLDEFQAALDTLKDSGEFEYAFDVNAGYTGEWWPYAYSPWLQSFGGDLINRDTYLDAEGALNGPEAAAWAEWFQSLFTEGYVPATPADDQGFLQGRIPLWYTGSWSAQAVLDQYGDDALFLPPPDFGNGPVIGAGSWQMGVTTNCPEDATPGAFEFVLSTLTPENIAFMSEATGLIPTSLAAADLTEDYAEGGPFRSFFDMAEAFALVRPETPGYLTISSQFEQAGLSIRDGGNIQDGLDDAVDSIEQDIEDNSGYGFGN
ncbi:MAG: extracellular solute-binding protein [Anaerolineae bacterium]|uniref:extracellular solute-binding protein n=1 Tax=Promineifilum sp. TaxID=2664178 RepID=UPI001D6FC993|nr:extracellular solute-binding protein [Anaerolineales bacterium]MCB8936397.1 extracellular solute-binding protein [Promineifilum sp.]MCO5182162.1 extracellular solute-binding protein [Promineifilum sp.]MCW5848087.1 extracellular solute-binding protein [Anaerolineae bacterium]